MTTAAVSTCPIHHIPFSEPRAHFKWGDVPCKACRDNARKAAAKVRSRDPVSIGLTRALYRTFGGRWFGTEQAERIAFEFALDRNRLLALLDQLGPGNYDHATRTGIFGDGLIELAERGGLQCFRFDELWLSSMNERVAWKKGPATFSPGPHSATASTPTRTSSPSSSLTTVSTSLATVSPLARVASGPRVSDARSANDEAPAILDSPRNERPDRRSPHDPIGRVDVGQLIELTKPDLTAAAARDEVLLRVSLTFPPWMRQRRPGATVAEAKDFRSRMLKMGASGVLLAKDISDAGAEHWFGLVSLPAVPSAAAARAAVHNAWVVASGAHSGCIRIGAVTAWAAFVDSGGDLDAAKGRYVFRDNLTRVLKYAFKPFPHGHGERCLSDILEEGFFTNATTICSSE